MCGSLNQAVLCLAHAQNLVLRDAAGDLEEEYPEEEALGWGREERPTIRDDYRGHPGSTGEVSPRPLV